MGGTFMKAGKLIAAALAAGIIGTVFAGCGTQSGKGDAGSSQKAKIRLHSALEVLQLMVTLIRPKDGGSAMISSIPV